MLHNVGNLVCGVHSPVLFRHVFPEIDLSTDRKRRGVALIFDPFRVSHNKTRHTVICRRLLFRIGHAALGRFRSVAIGPGTNRLLPERGI